MNYHEILRACAEDCDTWDKLAANCPATVMDLIGLYWLRAQKPGQAFQWDPAEPFVEGRKSETFWRRATRLVRECGGNDMRSRAAEAAIGRLFCEVVRDYYEDAIRKDFEEAHCYRDDAERDRDLMIPSRSVV